VSRRPLGLLSLLVLVVVLAAGCQVRTEVALDVHDDGSGTVTVSVGLDADAVSQVPDLASELRLDDLSATGWEITGPAVEADGLSWIRATKPFGTPAEAGAVLAEVAGEDGPFQDFHVTQSRSFARTKYEFTGKVDFSKGLESFSDGDLTAALDGQPLGESLDALEQRIGSVIDDAFTFKITVGMPGSVKSNGGVQASNGAVWEPRLSEARSIDLQATSTVTRGRTLVLTGVAVVAGLGAVVTLVSVPLSRRRRSARRGPAPRGRHAAS
jgi:hypothetical protein